MVQPRIALERPRLPAPLIAAAASVGAQAREAYAASGFARRVALAREVIPEEHEAGKPRLARMLGEAQALLEPMRRQVIGESDVRGTLTTLCKGVGRGRMQADERTVFKSVGNALEDLAAAMLVWQAAGH